MQTPSSLAPFVDDLGQLMDELIGREQSEIAAALVARHERVEALPVGTRHRAARDLLRGLGDHHAQRREHHLLEIADALFASHETERAIVLADDDEELSRRLD